MTVTLNTNLGKRRQTSEALTQGNALQSHLCKPYSEDIMSSKKGLVVTSPFLHSAKFVSYSLANMCL
jgi:hypothetical protein